MKNLKQIRRWGISVALVVVLMQFGCARFTLPGIDPTGNRIFAQNQTQLLTPGTLSGGLLGCNLGSCLNPLRGQSAAPAFNAALQPTPFTNSQPVIAAPTAPTVLPAVAPQYSSGPAYQHPADPPPCNNPNAGSNFKQVKHVIPKPTGKKTAGQKGQIIMTPSRIVAPVGSEVVVLAGICGDNGYFVKNQPLEWMLSNNSVGQFIEVGGTSQHSTFNQLVSPTAQKFNGQYAWGRTGLKNLLLSRGTPTPADDIELLQGQSFVSLASASPGTSYITGVAPKAEGWDRRRASTIVHWVDGLWAIPVPTSATAGTVHPLTTVVSRSTDGGGVEDWIVRYSIVGGAPAEFAPTGSQTAETKTNKQGQATAQIRQLAGQFEPGTTQVRVDVVRPPLFGEPELVVESGITSVAWSAPALTIRAIGPRSAEVDQPFNYRIEVTNPGDQISRDVVVRTKNLDDSIEFISSNPKPTEYGNVYQWSLGDIPPGSSPRAIDVQLKSKKRGNTNMCFEVASDTDRLRTEACAETEITAPCLEMDIQGPTAAQVGDQIVFNLNVQNQCNEPLEDIQLTISHDQGLNRPGKSNPATFQLPVLQFGETRSLPLAFDVQATGTRCFDVEITAKGGHAPYRERRCLEVGPGANSQISTNVGIDVRGGQPMEVGGDSQVSIQVTNNGSVPLEDVVLTNRFSSSVTPISISERFNDPNWIGDNEFQVYLGRIAPGQMVDVNILYQGEVVDENAVSEFSVTTPGGVNATDQISLEVRPRGGLLNGDGGVGGGQSGNGIDQPDFSGINGGSNGQIGIPADPVQQQGNLSVDVKTIDRTIQVINSGQPDPAAPQSSRVQFVVKNNGQTSLRDVDISLLVPPGITLTDFYKGSTNLDLVYRNDDFTQFDVRRCRELRPGESLEFMAVVKGSQPGLATFEVRAQSPDVNGSSTGRDSIVVAQ